MVQSGVLAQWQLHRPRVVRQLGGAQGSNWLVEERGRKWLLHEAKSPRAYIDYQLDAVAFLQATGFSLELPTFLATTLGARYHHGADGHWTLHSWVAGECPSISADRDVDQIATRVGEFDRIMARFDHGRDVGQFLLPLFDTEAPREPALSQFASLHRQLLERDGGRIRRLPVQTIYNDWHPWNLLAGMAC